MNLYRVQALFLCLALPLVVTACGNTSTVKKIAEVRSLPHAPVAPPLKVSSADRFGMGMTTVMPPSTSLPIGENENPSMSQQAVSGGKTFGLQWTAPEGWRRSGARPLREVTFTMGAGDDAECYVSVFPGDAGGIEANINRWTRQMGAPSLDAADIAALPAVEVLGNPAPMVELSGSFNDAMSGKQIPDGMLLGVVAEHGDNSIFIKLVGPASEVTAQKQNFIAFCQSLRH